MSSGKPRTPTGEWDAGRVANPSPVDLASVEHIVSKTSIADAWKKVKANKGAPGVDHIDIDKFSKWARPKWKFIKKQLLDGSYKPQPALRVEIPKESGGMRKLGTPCVLDRVVMQAIAKVLGDVFNPTFSEYNYGYRPERSAQQAAKQAQEFYRQGYTYQVNIDLEQFFDTVNHDVLMVRVARRVKNKDLLKLIGRFLRAGVVINGRLHPTKEGVPQGSPLSPILSNILLDDLDKELESRGHKFARYADDLAIFVKSKRAGERVLASVSRYLEQKLKVKVNQAKSKVSPVKASSVLGFKIHHKKLRTLVSKVQAFKKELKRITRRCPGISIASRIYRLKEYIQGLSKTLATNCGRSNAHLDKVGLISMRTLWCKIHHPATAR